MMEQKEALIALRRLYKQYLRRCGPRFAHVPFRASVVPGWVYYPVADIVQRWV